MEYGRHKTEQKYAKNLDFIKMSATIVLLSALDMSHFILDSHCNPIPFCMSVVLKELLPSILSEFQTHIYS